LLDKAAPQFECVDTNAEDPAILIYTSGTTGPPKGSLAAHRSLLGNLPGFQHSQDMFPQAGDVFWSPADWAWTGGLMDVLLPTLYFGQPVLGFRGRFDPDKAFYLMQKYAVTNTFLFPTALKMMMKTVASPRQKYKLALRSIMSAGEALGETVFAWCRDSLGVTVNEMFGQTEINYIVGNSHALWPAKPGSMGRPYPGHRVAVIDDDGNVLPAGEIGDVAVNRNWRVGEKDPVFFLGYWKNDDATRAKYTGDWCRTGDLAKADGDGDLWYQGRADDVFKSASYRIGPSEIENCLVKHPAGGERGGGAEPRRGARQHRQGVHRADGRFCAVERSRSRNPGARARQAGAVRIPEGNRIHRRAADDDDGQGAAAGIKAARSRAQTGHSQNVTIEEKQHANSVMAVAGRFGKAQCSWYRLWRKIFPRRRSRWSFPIARAAPPT
jgi:acyl-coenzyme A synthetase/AMP-(fatty) acid ligase